MEKRIDNYEKYIVTDEHRTNEEQKAELHKDRINYVYEEFYIPCYSNMGFWKNSDLMTRKTGVFNYVGPNDFKIEITGDASFSFKKGIPNNKKHCQKYEYFKELIMMEDNFSEEEKNIYLDELDYCNKMFYSFHNFALMPKNGSLNIFKGLSKYMKDKSHNLDRLDKFLYFLDEYYNNRDKGIENTIFSSSNVKVLKERLNTLLSSFDSVYDYCEVFYLINDKEFIDRLIENGKKDIKTGEDVVAYMELAKEFWNKRHEKLVENIKI